MKVIKVDDKTDNHWSILNESSFSCIFLTEPARTLVNGPCLDFVVENC